MRFTVSQLNEMQSGYDVLRYTALTYKNLINDLNELLNDKNRAIN